MWIFLKNRTQIFFTISVVRLCRECLWVINVEGHAAHYRMVSTTITLRVIKRQDQRTQHEMRMYTWSRNVSVKALVRWAISKRLTDRLPKLSLITQPPWNWPDIGVNVSPPTLDSNFWGSRSRFFMRKFTFLEKSFSWWTWDPNTRPTTHGPADDAIC